MKIVLTILSAAALFIILPMALLGWFKRENWTRQTLEEIGVVILALIVALILPSALLIYVLLMYGLMPTLLAYGVFLLCALIAKLVLPKKYGDWALSACMLSVLFVGVSITCFELSKLF